MKDKIVQSRICTARLREGKTLVVRPLKKHFFYVCLPLVVSIHISLYTELYRPCSIQWFEGLCVSIPGESRGELCSYWPSRNSGSRAVIQGAEP